MIQQTKMKSLSSCNNCSGYNIQPETHCNIKFKECGEVYQYIFAVGNAGIELRLCNKCATELKKLLEKQLGEDK